MSLDRITDSVKARSQDLAGLNARVMFDLGETGILVVDATATPPSVSNEPLDADCTIQLSAADMEKLIAGTLNPMLAYTLGKLKISGSMGIAMKLAALLDE
ncbi:MAG: SCP2 sterol-binding domain-containing protein [Kiloniellales bacterium]